MADEQEDLFSVILVLEMGTVRIDNKDLIDCYFIEDIYSHSMVGKLVFNDVYGMWESGPFTGHEKVYIVYGEETEKVTREFNIYKVNNISQLSNVDPSGKNTIDVTFTDNLFINLTKNRYSRSWTNTKISDIIEHIAKNMLDVTKFDQFESSNETLPYFYMPYWTPLEAINWLSRRGSGAESQTPGYLFYHNNKGYNYVTIEKLLRTRTILNTGVSYKGEDETYYFETKNLGYRNKILGWKMSGIDFTGMNSIRGGHTLGYNFKEKSLLDEGNTYVPMINNYTMLGKKTLFTDISNETMSYSMEGDNDTKLLNNIYGNSFIKKYCLQQCLNIAVRGSELRYAGAMIKIYWPSHTTNEIYNSMYDGYYMIKSITHSFKPYKNPAYRQKMVLIKNAFTDSIYPGLVKSAKPSTLGMNGH